MARPTTKNELTEASQDSFNKLMQFLDTMPKSVLEARFNFDDEKLKEAHWKRDRDVKDVLIHLYEWHQLLIRWVEKNLSGQKVSFLPDPYNWKSYGVMNVEFVEKHKKTSYDSAKTLFIESHEKVMEIIVSLSDEALFTKAYFDWAPTATVGSYCVSASASHYEWAYKKLRKHLKMHEAR